MLRFTQYRIFRTFANDVRFGLEARTLLMQGINVMANAVATTLGPKGRNVLIEQLLRSPKITKDGLIVADNVKPDDRRDNIGTQLLRIATNNTKRDVGDGSTTATILARGMAIHGMSIIRNSSINVHELREGMLKGTTAVCSELRRISKSIDRIGEVETVARNALHSDKHLAQLIGDGIMELGEGGVFLIKESVFPNDEIEIREGTTISEGFVSPLFAHQSDNGRLEFNNMLILLTTAEIEEVSDIVPALELAKNAKQPLLLIAKEFSQEVLRALVLNHLQNRLQICAVRAPSCGFDQEEQMQDISVAIGAHLIDDLSQLRNIKPDDLCVVQEVIIDSKATHLLHPRDLNETQLDYRIQYIKSLIADGGTDEELDKLRERLGRLLGHVAIIHVGGSSELEISEKKDRLKDALYSVEVAICDGIVPGGGTAFLRCINAVENINPKPDSTQQMGVNIIRNSLVLPCYTIARNSGANPDEVIHKVLGGKHNFGYDAVSGECCDLIERGIVDSTSVLCSALCDATAIASLITTTEVLITELRKKPNIPKNQVTNDLARLIGM